MNININQQKPAVCNTCTILLVRKAYARAPWFRLVREPLRLGMRLLGKLYRVNAADYAVRSEQCGGCVRFLKTALKEKSPVFRKLNDRMNPLFDRLMERVVTEEEIAESKRHAREMTASPPEEETP